MGIARRIGFGIFWFGIFWIALLTIGGGIAGSIAGAGSVPPGAKIQQGYQQGQDAGVRAGIEFRERFGLAVIAAAAVLAAGCTVAGVLPGTRRD